MKAPARASTDPIEGWQRISLALADVEDMDDPKPQLRLIAVLGNAVLILWFDHDGGEYGDALLALADLSPMWRPKLCVDRQLPALSR